MSPTLSIVIVNWNGMEFLPACLRSIAENPPSLAFEVVVVDNASSDRSRTWLLTEEASSIFAPGALKPILNDENLGFGRGNNVAFRATSSRYVLVLNPDSIVKPGAIDRLLRSLEAAPSTGAVAPKLFNEDGTSQSSVTLFPHSPITIVALALGLPKFLPRPLRERFYGEFWDHDEERAVPAFWGAAILVKREVIDQAGGFDEEFFMYGEDHEWCARINRVGWKTVYVPDAEIVHLGGRSSRQAWENREKEKLLWSGDILAHRKSVTRITAATNALIQTAIFAVGYVKRLVLGGDLEIQAIRVKLHLDAFRTSFRTRF